MEFPPVGEVHPEGVRLDPGLLDEIRVRVASATDGRIAAAVVRFLENTASTTVRRRGPRDTFVMTGDIPAMWLRDSCAQVGPLLRVAGQNAECAELIGGLLATHWRLMLIDPYANAFNEEPNGHRWDDDLPLPGPWVWERKWEIDSLAYPLDLAGRLLSLGSTSWVTEDALPALETIMTILETELRHEDDSDYTFQRDGCPPSDTLAREGRGRPTIPCGLVWQGFRPSDDACEHGYNIPGNLFMASALRAVPALVDAIGVGGPAAERLVEHAGALRDGIVAAVSEHGIGTGGSGEQVLLYEVDGAGDTLFMDDANVPSLLSLPYLGVMDSDDPLYRATREAVLSPENTYYYEGDELRGVGSPHTPEGYVWPIALSVEGLTTQDRSHRAHLLNRLLDTTGGTGYMHEGVDCDDPMHFTREWFSWSNAMFCELALEVAGYERPSLHERPLLSSSDAGFLSDHTALDVPHHRR